MSRKPSRIYRLQQVRQEVRRKQADDHRRLSGAVVGRPVHLDVPDINQRLHNEANMEGRLRGLGQMAVVYLFRDELREHRGKTFYNTAHVAQAIQKAPSSAGSHAVVGRDILEIFPSAKTEQPDTQQLFWLISHALQARDDTVRGNPVNLRAEEVAIANELFSEDSVSTLRPVIWLGAVAAKNLGSAQDTLEVLEDILPAQIPTRPVSLISISG